MHHYERLRLARRSMKHRCRWRWLIVRSSNSSRRARPRSVQSIQIRVSPRATRYWPRRSTRPQRTGCGRPRDPGHAERLLAKALELDPHFDQAHGNLIHHLHWMNWTQEALDHANAARSVRPNGPAILRGRAVALLYLKQTREVVRQLRDVAALAPISVQDEWLTGRRQNDRRRTRRE